MNFFNDANIEVVLDQVTAHDVDRYVWKGHVFGEDETSSVTLAINGDAVVGNIRSETGYFQIRTTADGQTRVYEMDDTQFGTCAVTENEVDAGPPYFAPRDEIAGDTGDIFDVLVVYTPAARAAVGGKAQMELLIDLAISETNTIYDNSLINSQVRLVHQEVVTYTESGNFSTDLTRLANSSDSYMDNVHTLRDSYGADLVALFIDDSSSCGVGYINKSQTPGSAFSVTHYSCATGYYSFAHEMGHNMGCHHALPETSQGTGFKPYSHGWRWNGDSYRSVMAYSPGSRVDHFSNPSVTHAGGATGVTDTADNARSINFVANTIANFRQQVNPSIVWVDFAQTVTGTGIQSYPYQFMEDAVALVDDGGSGVIKIKGNTAVSDSSETITISTPMTLQSNGGAVQIGATP